jgi:hypothetical protein
VYRKFEDVAEFERELERLDSEPPLQDEHLFELRQDQDARGGARKARSVRTRRQATRLPPETGNQPGMTGLAGLSEGNFESWRGR